MQLAASTLNQTEIGFISKLSSLALVIFLQILLSKYYRVLVLDIFKKLIFIWIKLIIVMRSVYCICEILVKI